MKILNYIFLILAATFAAIGAYNQIEVVPFTELDILSNREWLYYHDLMMNLGYSALLGGAGGLLGGVLSVVKKYKIGYITIAFGLIAIIFGLMQATHMFS